MDRFDIGSFRKECLLAGHDEIGYTLSQLDKVVAFEQARERQTPWI